VALLVLGLGSLPVVIQGDGALFGRVQVLIRYSLGFAAAVLALTTLWAACGGIAREIEDRRLFLVVAKPVHRHEIWFGKWAAIMALNTVLLLLVGGILAGMLAWALRPGAGNAAERQRAREHLLLARVEVPASPARDGFESMVRRQTATLLSAKADSPADESRLAAGVRRDLTRRVLAVAPTGSVTMTFRMPARRLTEEPVVFSCRPETSRADRGFVVVRWDTDGAASPAWTTNYPAVPWQQVIPAGGSRTDDATTLTLTREPDQNTGALLLAPDGVPPVLLVPTGTFGPNLLRTLAIIWCRLAFLAALGLAAGSLLSMPVAVCATFFAVVLLSSSGYVRTVAVTGVFYVPHDGDLPEPTWVDAATLRLFKAMDVMTRPLAELDPLPLIGEGRRVAWGMLGRAFAILACLYTGIAALVGIALFRRRELG
jgi:hypothetical protein